MRGGYHSSVLAVDDVDAVLGDLSVDAGGGFCGAWASPDGRFLLVDAHGD